MYVLMFAFIFHCRSFSPCGPLAFLIFSPPLWIFMFFFPQNSSLLFPVTRSSSLSVNHVSVNIKNNVEKDTPLLLFFLFKSPGGHAISFQIKPWVAFRLPYLLIELFYIGMPVVRSVGRCTVTWLPNFLGWVVHHIFLPMVFRCALRYKNCIRTYYLVIKQRKSSKTDHQAVILLNLAYMWQNLDSRELKQLRRRRQLQKTICLIIKTTALYVLHGF